MIPLSASSKRMCSISLDLDNKWSFLKTHGDKEWEKYPSYLDTFVPLVLDVLDELGLKITFFIVGRDAAFDKNNDVLGLITERGHEVGNHSFNHEVWMHKYPKEKIEKEILDAEEQINKVTGQKPAGFRGPGFVWSPTLLETLADNQYLYDASFLPTYIGPLARAYFFSKSGLSRAGRSQRKGLFGSFREGFRSVKPHFLDLGSNRKLLEIPVTTMPVFKVPFHLSYLLYLSCFSEILMLLYLKTALGLCRASGVSPSFLLHPLDFIDAEQIPELKFFPGMYINRNEKKKKFHTVINIMRKYFRLTNMSTYAKSIISPENINMLQVNAKFVHSKIAK
jgi:hypothetical protein